MKVYIAGKITGNENYKAEFARRRKSCGRWGISP